MIDGVPSPIRIKVWTQIGVQLWRIKDGAVQLWRSNSGLEGTAPWRRSLVPAGLISWRSVGASDLLAVQAP